MRKIIAHEFISLDGVIQAPGGKEEDTDGGFTHGGWTMPYWDDAIGTRFSEVMQKADTLLLGRKTWEIHGSAFETMEGEPFADELNALKKYVVSTTLTSTDLWRNSSVISGDVVSKVKKLKSEKGKHILIDGSSVLMHTLFENNLVDTLQLHVYPVVLGTGKKLFGSGTDIALKLKESIALSSGVVFMEYEVTSTDKTQKGGERT